MHDVDLLCASGAQSLSLAALFARDRNKSFVYLLYWPFFFCVLLALEQFFYGEAISAYSTCSITEPNVLHALYYSMYLYH